jgi:hypothetical protein
VLARWFSQGQRDRGAIFLRGAGTYDNNNC